MQTVTVSWCVYMQSVSSQIRIKVRVGVILRHDSHCVMTNFEMTFGTNRVVHHLKMSRYMQEYSIHFKTKVLC